MFDCEDEEESRPAATGDDAFNFGCLDGVDCTMYLVDSTVLRIQGRKEGIIGLGITFVLAGKDNQWYILTMTGCCARSTVALQSRGSEWSDVHDLGAVV